MLEESIFLNLIKLRHWSHATFAFFGGAVEQAASSKHCRCNRANLTARIPGETRIQ
jgi:hypothetical protein